MSAPRGPGDRRGTEADRGAAPDADRRAAGEARLRARAALRAIVDRVRPTLLARADEMEGALAAMMEGRLTEPQRKAAERAAHQLAGSAGTLGMPRATDLARQLEAFFASGPSAGSVTLLSALDWLEALRAELDATPAGASDTSAQPSPQGRDLLLAFGDRELAARLIAAAQARNLPARWAPDLPTAAQLVRDQPPGAVLLDLDLPQGGGLQLLGQVARDSPVTATVVLSREGRFLDRVEAGRAGAHAFVPAALPPERLIASALDLIDRQRAHTVRLLAADDDPVVVAVLEELFLAAGMELTTVSDPLKFWGVLEETAPDLVLLDIDMPDVTGLELCRLLRADPRWAALPVLVLTGSVDAGSVREVFAAGADDYVPKPIVGPELVARIDNRLDRVRLFRRATETDQLTGLANRTAFDAEFARLASIAARDEQPLTIALIDMDGFKQVNYRHGHAFGDVVLQRLAVRLSAAFRGGDVIARWGGQEIAVAMYGMRRTDGVARVAGVLEGFREESFETSSGPLHMTFAAGIAEYPLDGTDLVRLIRAAGAAVLEAKRTGGDRVLPAGWVSEDDKSATDVLLVEDDEVLASLLMQALHTRGLRSRHVADGQTALDLLIGPDRLRARVVLLDVDLPGVNGLDVLGQLSRERVVERSRVIMLTARSGESEVLTALRQGAFDHVAKPFSVPVLMQRIRRALDG